VDPCGRSVCHDAVGKHIELLGRSIKQAVIRTRRYTIRFKSVTIRTVSDLRGSDPETFRFEADEVVKSGQSGGGSRLVDRLTHARAGYVQQVTKEITRRLRARRVPLTGSPQVQRGGGQVTVTMEIHSDRTRYRSHVGAALLAAGEALRANPLTPPRSELKVVAAIRFRKLERRTFTCMGEPVKLHLAGSLSLSELWDSYITEHKKGGTQLSFSDEEATGGDVGQGTLDEGRVQEILAGHFNLLAPCLQSEAGRNRRFRGVTLSFSIAGSGKAAGVTTGERATSQLKSCVAAALARIRFPRHAGAPRPVSYPMYIRR